MTRPRPHPLASVGRALIALVGTGLAAGCAMGETPCRVGADCESGVCLVGGECAPPEETDAGPTVDAGEHDAGATPDAGPTVDAGAIDAGAPSCGDGDGVIGAAELPLRLDEAIELRVAFDVAVDTHGAERADGTRLWDFEGPFDGDADRAFTRRAVGGAWYAGAFEGATYTLPLSAERDLLGVFEQRAGELLLRGVVSPEGGALRTELTYDPPVPVFRLPLEPGASWSATSTVTGLTNGVASLYTEAWSFEVDARGDVTTPAGVRSVLRVRSRLTRTAGAVVTFATRHSYVEECVGTVAQVFGADFDASDEPSRAVEVWRVR